jgi:hypothetical protein
VPFFYRGKRINPYNQKDVMKTLEQMTKESDSYSIKKLQGYLQVAINNKQRKQNRSVDPIKKRKGLI